MKLRYRVVDHKKGTVDHYEPEERIYAYLHYDALRTQGAEVTLFADRDDGASVALQSTREF